MLLRWTWLLLLLMLLLTIVVVPLVLVGGLPVRSSGARLPGAKPRRGRAAAEGRQHDVRLHVVQPGIEAEKNSLEGLGSGFSGRGHIS